MRKPDATRLYRSGEEPTVEKLMALDDEVTALKEKLAWFDACPLRSRQRGLRRLAVSRTLHAARLGWLGPGGCFLTRSPASTP